MIKLVKADYRQNITEAEIRTAGSANYMKEKKSQL